MKKIVLGALAATLFTGCGALAGEPEPLPTVTVTATTTVTATPPTVTVTAEPPPPPVVTSFDGKPEDFHVPIRVTEKKCFGSAGCNVTYAIDAPTYLGVAQFPTTGAVEVTYQVVGGESAVIDTFTVEDGQVAWNAEGRTSTANESDELTVEVTNVTYRTY